MPRLRATTSEYFTHAFSDLVRGELARKKLKRQGLADYLGMTQQAVGQKLLNRTEWTLSEMAEACEYLEINFTVGVGRREE